ncbi:MAG: type II toxin-antitoxin system RelE/ParE family toxin [Polyangiaceae bacterium]|nr:type II toxin-antitoxin system RelE/ParE family toxin [Polyangiaceae bacterium]
MRVELSAEAEAKALVIDAWWRENRRGSPELFVHELEMALQALGNAPGVGTPYRHREGVRRLLLRRSHYHVYFVERAGAVFVLAVWSAFRGTWPAL